MEGVRTSSLVALGVITSIVVIELFLSLVGDVVPEQSLWPSVESELKSDQLRGLEASPDVVVLGSSTTESGVDPVALADAIGVDLVYNSALPFSSPLSHEIWLDSVLEGFHPRLLIIGVPPSPYLGDGPGGLGRGIETATRQPLWLRALSWSELALSRGVFSTWDQLKAREALRESDLWTPLGHQTGYYERSVESGTVVDGVWNHSAMSVEQTAALERILRNAEENGSEVVLVLEAWLVPADVEDEIARFATWLEVVSAELGVAFLNAHSQGWSEDLYADPTHFNEAGTKAYTAYLGDAIDRILKEDR